MYTRVRGVHTYGAFYLAVLGIELRILQILDETHTTVLLLGL